MTISVIGNFSIEVQSEFRNSYENTQPQTYIIDLAQTEYLDSSALGMLLMMREYAGGDGANIVLRNCGQDIQIILKVANFQRLFTIE